MGEVGMAYLLDLISAARGDLPLKAQDMLLEAVVNLSLDPWCAAELYDHARGIRMLLAQAGLPCRSSLRVSALMALLNIANLGGASLPLPLCPQHRLTCAQPRQGRRWWRTARCRCCSAASRTSRAALPAGSLQRSSTRL